MSEYAKVLEEVKQKEMAVKLLEQRLKDKIKSIAEDFEEDIGSMSKDDLDELLGQYRSRYKSLKEEASKVESQLRDKLKSMSADIREIEGLL